MWLYNGEEPPVFDPPPEEEDTSLTWLVSSLSCSIFPMAERTRASKFSALTMTLVTVEAAADVEVAAAVEPSEASRS